MNRDFDAVWTRLADSLDCQFELPVLMKPRIDVQSKAKLLLQLLNRQPLVLWLHVEASLPLPPASFRGTCRKS